RGGDAGFARALRDLEVELLEVGVDGGDVGAAAEVELLATLGGRRTALSWAAGYGKKRQMKEFLKAATRLANTRQRILSGRDVQLHQAEERRELQRILALRAAVAG
ncbi:MAG: hypothetical protein ACLGIS_18495, partial [Actinomycetes bacterium]